jgi:hypothetical protein
MERDDGDFMVECRNDIDFWGEYVLVGEQVSKSEWIRYFDNPSNFSILTEWKSIHRSIKLWLKDTKLLSDYLFCHGQSFWFVSDSAVELHCRVICR